MKTDHFINQDTFYKFPKVNNNNNYYYYYYYSIKEENTIGKMVSTVVRVCTLYNTIIKSNVLMIAPLPIKPFVNSIINRGKPMENISTEKSSSHSACFWIQ